MSVYAGFMILLMALLLYYTSLRLYMRRKTAGLVVVCIQLFTLTLAATSFFNDVYLIWLYQLFCIGAGVLFPAVLMIRDFACIWGKTGQKFSLMVLAGSGLDQTFRKLSRAGFEDDTGQARIYEENGRENASKENQDFKRGVSLHNMGIPEEAVKCFETATAHDRRDYRAYYNLGVCLDELGRRSEAIKALKWH